MLSLRDRRGDTGKLREYCRASHEARGGRFLAGGNPVQAYEAGLNQRLVIIEFESGKKAIEAYKSAEYQAALAISKDSAERDVRII